MKVLSRLLQLVCLEIPSESDSVCFRLTLLSKLFLNRTMCDKASTFLKSPIPIFSEQSCKATGRSFTHPQLPSMFNFSLMSTCILPIMHDMRIVHIMCKVLLRKRPKGNWPGVLGIAGCNRGCWCNWVQLGVVGTIRFEADPCDASYCECLREQQSNTWMCTKH